MSFERTPLGQANRHIFMRADAIVYVEGGDQEANSEHSPDITYWRSLFRCYKPQQRLRFLAKGSKQNLIPLARDIINNNIANVFVAMDSDYDGLLSSKIDDSRIMYTYGYSWENDVFIDQNIFETFISIFHMCSSHQQAWIEVLERLAEFKKAIFWVAVADYVSFRIGSSVIPRSKPGKILIDRGKKQPPAVDRAKAREYVANANSEGRARSTGGIAGFDVPRFCVGHLFEAFVARLFGWLSYKFAKAKNVSNDHITSMAIQMFASFLTQQPEAPISTFYADQFARA